MKTNYLVLKFNGCRTVIELLNTPVVEKWISAFNSNRSKGTYDLKPENASAFIHGHNVNFDVHPVYGYTASDVVNSLNSSIDEATSLVKGAEFPYRAFPGMSWEQTNLIHRCFTTSASTSTNWQHGFTPEQLFNYKKTQYDQPHIIKDIITNKQFEVSDYNRFLDVIHEINMWVHRYESFYVSERITKLAEEVSGTGEYLELDWDNFNNIHEQQNTVVERVSYEQLKQSFPDNYSDMDVFLGKYIKGKDYEFAYCEYDNLLEFDITNVDGINGGLRVHYNDIFKKIYSDSSYLTHLKSLGLEEEMYLPVPVGKIVESTCDFSQFKPDYNSEEKWSNGMIKPLPPFNSVNSYLTQF